MSEIEVAVEAQIIHMRTDRLLISSLVFNILEGALLDQHRDSLISLSIRARPLPDSPDKSIQGLSEDAKYLIVCTVDY